LNSKAVSDIFSDGFYLCRDLFMSNASLKGRILAIDYGHRRIGVAVSDPLRITAQLLPTIHVVHPNQVLSDLEKIILEKNVTEIVIGMPLNLKGQKGSSAEKVERFVQELDLKFHLPVHTWDERWTTIEAQRTIWELGKSPSRHKSKVDQIAALLILQTFLNYLSLKSQHEG
jgi:putative Holliday junction resolvase